ncbi:type IV toxin-antitoxin system YeeU family antitoxin [Klebsiella pneumoniae]|uniref:type IV toxin-antitoxin system YeeU family antitoxin n=1 Tax=Klebsiella pneumoniae TaxID=573 RepID=UPI0007CC7AE7|nr:type IV toxin-antitoxin system YeeU family antitoxin [Klebsiella pneumoniae]OVX68159.1 antitoxin [Klebsiella pneumoniae]SAU49252.1 putative antitoxin module of toxin-antitoxin system [Klebsiella pneumoniae]SWZ57506.1 putative antitoxin module of toxin-antitoxin system [Klebsiella pneumoniae]VVK54150.1 Putative antitoxin YfjZ [Klebsiella pneumoniae]HBQ0772395.1 type IV toxin-antitoxin system YeeU family antitoxin [Klebsiella pneumoniae]
MPLTDAIQWGLKRSFTPNFGARLVQEGNRLHYLADRANITGKFGDAECLKLEEAFPHFIRQMELMLSTGELNPRHVHSVTLYHNVFTCEADTLGSCGYVYIVIYPTQR